MLKCPNIPQLIQQEIHKKVPTLSKLHLLPPNTNYETFDLLEPIETLSISDGPHGEVYVSWPSILGILTETKEKVRLCHLTPLFHGKSKKRKRPGTIVECLDSLASLSTSIPYKGTPFPHGVDPITIPMVGKETFETIMQCYHLWFREEVFHRTLYDLEHLRPETFTLDELDVLEQTLRKSWERMKKAHLKRTV